MRLTTCDPQDGIRFQQLIMAGTLIAGYRCMPLSNRYGGLTCAERPTVNVGHRVRQLSGLVVIRGVYCPHRGVPQRANSTA